MESVTFKNTKTFLVCVVWVTMGLYGMLGGPTMLDLKLLFQTNYQSISQAMSGIGLGGFPGAIMAGLLVDRFPHSKDAFLATSHVCAATAIILIPFSSNTWVMWLLFLSLGMARGAVNVVGIKVILEMWEDKAAVPLHAIHMGFGIGAILAPILANPFLAGTAVDDFSDKQSPPEISLKPTDTHVQYVFLIIGLITAFCTLPFFYYQYQKNKHFSKQYKALSQEDGTDSSSLSAKKGTDVSPEKSTPRPSVETTFKLVSLLLLFAYYFNITGGEQTFGSFARAYSVDQLKFTKDQASLLNTVFWVGFVGGRFLGSVLSHWIPIRILLSIEGILYLGITIIFGGYSSHSQTLFWRLTLIQGIIIAPMYPSGISYANTLMDVSGSVLMLVEISGGLGTTVYLTLAGKMYDTFGPHAIFRAMQISGAAVFVDILIFVVLGCAILRKRTS